MRSWATENSVEMAHTVAVGDGGNDVVMLRDAGIGIAFVAKQVAKDASDVVIDVPDLRRVWDVITSWD